MLNALTLLPASFWRGISLESKKIGTKFIITDEIVWPLDTAHKYNGADMSFAE